MDMHSLWRVLGCALLTLAACTPVSRQTQFRVTPAITRTTELEVQALVMKMADDYNTALSEAIYLSLRNAGPDSKGRWLAQSFLRNGMGASLDIAAGPNPDVALLDLLVLASLQSWSFREHWIAAGIGQAGMDAADRLREAESAMWQTASRILTEEQRRTLRDLISHWIELNPHRTVVSLIRFEAFVDERMMPALALQRQAAGLLREVTDATAAVESAVLLGERIRWYAARYPYVLGQQAELTLYRAVDQPEVKKVLESLDAVRELGGALASRARSIESDLEKQQERLFARVSAERTATIKQAEATLSSLLQKEMDQLESRVTAQRKQVVAEAFDRLSTERAAFLDDLESRRGALQGVLTDVRQTIGVSNDLAHALTGTADAIDRVVARFDQAPDATREPLKIQDIRQAAIETRLAAEQLTKMLEITNEVAVSGIWDERLGKINGLSAGLIDRLFWRGVILLLLLIAGLTVLRLIPRRESRPAAYVVTDSSREAHLS